MAFLAVASTLNPAGNGPGVTCDELLYAVEGKRLVAAWREQRVGFFATENIRANFPWRQGDPPFHPPLGAWLIGWTHHLLDSAPDEPLAVSIFAARLAPAGAFGLLVFLAGLSLGPGCGRLGPVAAAACVALVPRMFAHAHFAALDMVAALLYFAAVLSLIEAVERGGRAWQIALAGVVWGLALLTKANGLLLIVPAWTWLFWHLRRRAAGPIAVWTAAGVLTMFIGWPWLWLAPLDHFRLFLSTTIDRLPLHVFYLGQAWEDVSAPWHYAPAMFLVSVPVGVLAMGLGGLWGRRRELLSSRRLSFILLNFMFVLLVFSWPGVPVYDGVRLFLVVFVLWAPLVGWGAGWVAERLAQRGLRSSRIAIVVSCFVAAQGIGLLVYHPYQSSYYNALLGGLWGAEKLGFEVTYWGDSVQGEILAAAAAHAPGQAIAYGPNLAPFQFPAVQASSHQLHKAGVTLVGFDVSKPAATDHCRYALVYHRRADLDALESLLEGGSPMAEVRRQGVWLARLYRLNRDGPVDR